MTVIVPNCWLPFLPTTSLYPPAADTSAALNQTYHTWGKPTVLMSWTSPDPCRAIYVQCSNAGQVTSIEFPPFNGIFNHNTVLPSGGIYAFPDILANYTSLKSLQLEAIYLYGQLSPSFSRLTNLQSIDMVENQLTGGLPPQWSTMTALTAINLGFNGLAGTLPVQWSTMTNLQSVILYDNFGLTGSFPAQWSTLVRLRGMDFQSTSLCGPVEIPLIAQLIDRALMPCPSPAQPRIAALPPLSPLLLPYPPSTPTCEDGRHTHGVVDVRHT